MSKPEIFTTACAIDKQTWIHVSDDVGFMEHIKNHLGHQLAERIFQECQSGEKIVSVGNTYKKEIRELYQIEIRGEVSIEDLVRCKDCKYQSKGENESESWNLCGYRPWQYTPTSDDHFCGYGKRREE